MGSEVEVRDPTGKVVLTTGGRYWTSPTEYTPDWVVGQVKPCRDCALGGGPLEGRGHHAISRPAAASHSAFPSIGIV